MAMGRIAQLINGPICAKLWFNTRALIMRGRKKLWNWSSGYGEIENLKSLQMTDDRWSEKLNLAFSSSELTKTKKKYDSWLDITIYSDAKDFLSLVIYNSVELEMSTIENDYLAVKFCGKYPYDTPLNNLHGSAFVNQRDL